MHPFDLYQNAKPSDFLNPGLLGGLRKSIKVKNALFASGNYQKYKQYRNKIFTLVRGCSKKSYYHSYFNDHITNVRKTWIGINHLIGLNKRRCKPIVALPIALNELFFSVSQTLAASVPPTNHHFSDYTKFTFLRPSQFHGTQN